MRASSPWRSSSPTSRSEASLAERFPKAAGLLHRAKEDLLAFRHFPKDYWYKIWSTNLLERVKEEIK